MIAKKQEQPHGFTLMELLVSMTLMGLLAVAIHFGFRVGTNAWAKGDRQLERIRVSEATFDLMSRQLASMVPYYSQQHVKGAPVSLLLFQGTETGMRFVTSFSSQSRVTGGFRLAEYFLANSRTKRDGKALYLNEAPLATDETLAQTVFRDISQAEDGSIVTQFYDFVPRPDSVILADGIDAARFGYFQPQHPPETLPSFNLRNLGASKERLPTGIEIHFRWSDRGLLLTNEMSIVIPVPGAGV